MQKQLAFGITAVILLTASVTVSLCTVNVNAQANTTKVIRSGETNMTKNMTKNMTSAAGSNMTKNATLPFHHARTVH